MLQIGTIALWSFPLASAAVIAAVLVGGRRRKV